MANPWQWIDQTALDEDKTRQELEEWKHVQRRKLADDWVVKQKELVRIQFEQLAKIREAQFDQPEIRASQITQPTVESQVQTPIEPEVLGPTQPKPEVLGPPTPSALDRVAEYRRTMKPPKLFGVPMELPEAKPEQSFAETLLNAARPFGEKVEESSKWADQKYRESLLRLGDTLGRKGRRLEDREAEAHRGFTPMIPEGVPRAIAGLAGDVLNKAFTGNRVEGVDPATMIRLQRENPELLEKLLKEQQTQGRADWERWKTEEVNPAVEIAGSLTNPLGWLGGGSVTQMARAGLGLPKILKASEAAEKAIKSAPKVIEGTSRVLGDIPAGMGTKAKTQGILLNRFEEPGVPVGSPDKPHGLYTTPADVQSPHGDLGGEQSTWRLLPEAKMLDVTPYEGKSIAMRRDAIDAGAGVHAARYLLGDVEFTRLKNLPKTSLISEAEKMFPNTNVEWNRYYDSQEVMEAIGAMKAREQGYDAIRVIDPKDPAFTEVVLLNSKSVQLEPKIGEITSKFKPSAGLSVEDVPGPNTMKDVAISNVVKFWDSNLEYNLLRKGYETSAGAFRSSMIEAAGDMLREWYKPNYRDAVYINEKIRRLEKNLNSVDWTDLLSPKEIKALQDISKTLEDLPTPDPVSENLKSLLQHIVDGNTSAIPEDIDTFKLLTQGKMGILSKIKPSIGLSVEDVPGPNTMKDVSQFFSGLGKDMGRMAREADLRAAEKKMSNLRKQYPDVTDEQVASTPLGQQIARYKQELGLTSPVEPPLTTLERQSTVDDTAGEVATSKIVDPLKSVRIDESLDLPTKPTRTNTELSSLLEALSGSEANKFKSAAYKKAADAIKSLGDQEVTKLLEGKIPGIGKGIQTRIKEYIDTGTIQGSSSGAKNITPSGGPKGASYTGPTRTAGHEQLWNRVRNVISHQGESGKQLAEMLHESREISEKFAGKLNSMIPTVRSLNRKEFNHFIDVAESKVKPGNDRIAKAFAEWDKARDIIYQRAKAAKIDIGFEPDYYPHMYAPGTFKGDKWNLALDRLVRTKAASNKVEAAKLLRYLTGTVHNRRQGNLEIQRTVDLPGYRRTKDVLLTYIQEATDRIAEVETFGKSDVKAIKLINKISGEGYDSSAALHLFNVAVGAEQYGKSRETASRVLRAYMVLTKLGFGALSNVQQPLNTATVGGISKTLKNIPLALSKEGQEFATKAGVILDPVIMNLREGAGYEGTWGRIGAPFFNEVEMFNRQLTAVVGREIAYELFAKAKAGSQSAIKELNKARINIENLDALSEDDVIRYARNLVERTQFKVDPQDLQVWVQTPSGKLIMQFRTFGYNQTAFMAREVLAPLKEGNVMPLVRFMLLGMPIGFLSVEARNILSVRPREEDMNKSLMDYFIQIGGLGLAGDIIRGVIPWRGTEYRDPARSTLRTTGTILGPAGSTALEGIEAGYNALQGKPTNLERFGIKQIPVVGRPIQNILLPYDDPTLTPLQKRRLERQRGSSTSLRERRLKRIQERR